MDWFIWLSSSTAENISTLQIAQCIFIGESSLKWSNCDRSIDI